MRFLHVAFFFIFALSSALSTASFADPLSDLSTHPDWLRIVHYEKSMLNSGYTSRGWTTGFFLDPQGRKDPAYELNLLYNQILNIESYNGDRDDHGRCRFPARSKWLAEKLNLKIPEDNWCPKYWEWKSRIRAKSVTLVFSSYYLNNPSSAYGHTLLRLNRRDLTENGVNDSEGLQLLDFGFNYGAVPTSNNPIIYAISGSTGMMPGSFLSLPYYYKVREYNDFEARDLWEYDLKLELNEVDRLVDHFWEAAHTQFGYVYFTQNCGFHILNLIDVAAPRYQLMDQLRHWVMPGDTIRIVQNAGVVERVKFRPSVRRQFLVREAKLNPEQQKILKPLAADPANIKLLDGYSPLEKANIVDAAMDYIDLIHSRELIEENAPIKKKKNTLLIARSRLPITEPLVIPAPREEEPHTAHPSARVGVGYESREYDQSIGRGQERRNEFIKLKYRAALHDLVDPNRGYLKNSKTEMGEFDFRYEADRSNLQLQKFNFLALDSLGPLSNYNDKTAWRISIGAERRTDVLCTDCVRSEFLFGMGYAYEPWLNFNTFALMVGRAAYSADFVGNELAANVGPTLGMTSHLTEKLAVQIEWSWAHSWQENKNKGMSEVNLLARYFFRPEFALNMQYSKNPYEQKGEAALYYYY